MIAWLKRTFFSPPALLERCEPWPPPPAEGIVEQQGDAIQDVRGTLDHGTLSIASPRTSPAASSKPNGWENVSRITRNDGSTPLRRRLALSRDFDLDVHNMLWDANVRLLEGESIDLDHVADLIEVQVRKHLRFVYEPAPEGR